MQDLTRIAPPVSDHSPGGNNPLQGAQVNVPLGDMNIPMPYNLIATLHQKLEARRLRRRVLEVEWIDAYRRYDGQYDPTTLNKIQALKRSAVWLNFTSMKVHQAHAAIIDFLVGQDEAPWDIDPEPMPAGMIVPIEYVQQGITPEIINEELKHRCERLKQCMKDQLAEAGFVKHLDSSVLEMCIPGTGALKGPITIKRRERQDYNMVLNPATRQMYPQEVTVGGYMPELAAVSIFSLFPDMECPDVQKGDGIFEEQLVTRAELIDLLYQPDINKEAILATLTENPNGNAVVDPIMCELRMLSGDPDPMSTNRFSVVEYYGPVLGRELAATGMNIPQKYLDLQVNANVLFTGRYILRAKVHKGMIPYYLFPYVQRPGMSPFGKGIPMLCKHTQDTINGAARMMLDNAAISSGPIIEANSILLEPGQDPRDIHGWKVFVSKIDPVTGQNVRAIQVYDLPNYTHHFLRMIEMFRAYMDEESFIPSITGGQQGSRTTKTALGMSILNANSNRTLKKIMRNVDNYAIKPLIAAWVEWNLRYNPNISMLARVKVTAKGVLSIMAQEMQIDRLMALTGAFGHLPYFKVVNALRQIVEGMDMPVDDLVMSDQEMAGMVSPDIAGGAGATEMAAATPQPGGPTQPPTQNAGARTPQQGAMRAIPGGRA
ncbi:MAG TPA: hypothetical protein PK213_16225 [Deltaproteobacteria bacterium]|mgnify:CR=1 FL=1|nr:hypothetical protein [Deltaproteobacteria bacterium]